MAKAEKRTSTVKLRKMRGKHKFMLIIFSIIMMGLLRTGFMFMIIGLMPSIVAYYMDVSKHRFTFKSIFASNLSGMLPYIGKIIHYGPGSTVLQEVMGTGTNWVIIYGSALIGWMLVQIGPMMAQVFIHGFHQTQLARLNHLQKKIESEWGPEVTQFTAVGEG